MITEISVERWQSLVQTSAAFAKLAPWNWLADNQVFGFVHPKTQEKGYCCVMGLHGDFKAMAIYPGKRGWLSYHFLNSDQAPEDPFDVVMAQRCLMVVFQTVEDTDPQDLALLRHIKFPLKGANLVPAFRSYQPGFLPWAPNLEEIEWLEVGLAQALQVAINVSAAPALFPPAGYDEHGKMLIRQMNAEGSWDDHWLSPEPTVELSPVQVQASAEQIARALAIPQGEGLWLLEEFFMPEPVEDAGLNPFFPHTLLLFDMETYHFRGISMLQPNQWPDLIAATLVEFFHELDQRPAQIVISNKANLVFFKKALNDFGIPVLLEEGAEMKQELKDLILEMLRQQKD